MALNPYIPFTAIVENVIEETHNIKTVVLLPQDRFEFKAGQFIELTIPGLGEAPFTPSSSPYIKERLEVTIMNVGKVTRAIHNLKPKDVVGLRGPFGKEYPLEQFKGKEILIVGGGVGLAPLRSLFLALVHDIADYKKIVFCYGSRTPQDIVYKNAILDAWQKFDKRISFRLSVDRAEGKWEHGVGVVTNTLDKLNIDMKNSVAIVCGPPIMMKFSTFKLLEIGYDPKDIYLSMEKNMSCGIGKCGHCQMGKFYVCCDGPVFTYNQIKDIPDIWD